MLRRIAYTFSWAGVTSAGSSPVHVGLRSNEGCRMSDHSGVRTITLAVLLLVFPTLALAQSVVGVLGIAAEVAPIERRLQDSREVAVRGYVFRVGNLNGRKVVVGRSGIGKVNAAIVTTLLIGEFNPSAILFSGTAGAIDPGLHPGDVVIGATVAQHDVGLQTSDGIRRRGIRNAVDRRSRSPPGSSARGSADRGETISARVVVAAGSDAWWRGPEATDRRRRDRDG